jgi:enoyl-CoA hydratase
MKSGVAVDNRDNSFKVGASYSISHSKVTNETYETVVVEERGSATWIRLARPDALNAVDFTMMRELPCAVEHALDRRPTVLVLTGTGRGFCAGADLRDLGARIGPDGLSPEDAAVFAGLTEVFERLLTTPTVVLAAVNGVCVAGGLELVLVSDLVVAQESARFGDGHVNFGLLPAGGSSVLLPRVVGLANARRLLYTGEIVDAHEAASLGLVQVLVPDGELEGAVDALTEQLAQKPADALAELKRLSALAWTTPPLEAMKAERDAFAGHLLRSSSVREGLAAFAAGRPPQFGKRD